MVLVSVVIGAVPRRNENAKVPTKAATARERSGRDDYTSNGKTLRKERRVFFGSGDTTPKKTHIDGTMRWRQAQRDLSRLKPNADRERRHQRIGFDLFREAHKIKNPFQAIQSLTQLSVNSIHHKPTPTPTPSHRTIASDSRILNPSQSPHHVF